VRSPADGRVVGTVCEANPDQIEEAVAADAAAAAPLAALPAHRRAAALAHVSDCIAARAEELHAVIRDENGKLIMWARAEVTRAASTVRWAAEEARRWSSSLQRLDTDPTGEGRLAVVRRFPRGPVLGISPFNFPLNLVAHKVAPALAVGTPIVMKPAPKTPLSALLLGKLLSETDLPAGSWSLLIALDAAMPDWWPICACQWCLAPAPDPSAGRSAPRSRPSTSPSSWGQRRSPGRLRWSSLADLRWAAQRSARFATFGPASPAYPASASTPTRACTTRCCPR